MEHSARIYNCARCHRQVIICSCCDRGNIYCGSDCSQAASKESLRAASKRYQSTYKGRMNHAKRQRDYRRRRPIKVTHIGSQEVSSNDLLQFETNEDIKIIRSDGLYCHFCGCSCSPLLRTSFLGREKTIIPGVWSLGP